jgi:hypothetical protein
MKDEKAKSSSRPLSEKAKTRRMKTEKPNPKNFSLFPLTQVSGLSFDGT